MTICIYWIVICCLNEQLTGSNRQISYSKNSANVHSGLRICLKIVSKLIKIGLDKLERAYFKSMRLEIALARLDHTISDEV